MAQEVLAHQLAYVLAHIFFLEMGPEQPQNLCPGAVSPYLERVTPF
jgi:hypothetical protein